jgi:hypothetical protein
MKAEQALPFQVQNADNLATTRRVQSTAPRGHCAATERNNNRNFYGIPFPCAAELFLRFVGYFSSVDQKYIHAIHFMSSAVVLK